MRSKTRGLLLIALGIGLLAFYGLLVVETAGQHIIGPLDVRVWVFNAYPAALGVFFIVWGYYTLRSDRSLQDSP